MMALVSLWWMWAAAALVFAILEVLLPGYILLGFAAGAAGVAILLGIGAALPISALLLVFAVVSLAAWIAMRKVFGLRGGSVKTFDHDINDT